MEKPGDETVLYCNICAGDRDHQILFSTQREWHDDGDFEHDSYDEVEQCLVAACCGCKHRTFVHRWWNSPDVAITQYPPRTARKKPDWLFHLYIGNIADPTKHELINEIYSALGANCPRLAVLGIRSLLEHMMIEQIGDRRSFEKNLDAFQEKGCISPVQRTALTPVIEAGHASMHRAYKPPLEDVLHCLDVIESVILAIYIYPARSSQMKIPPRQNVMK